MSRRHVLMLAALAALWGSSFMLIEIALRDLHPLTLVMFRLLPGVLLLGAVAAVSPGLRAAAAATRGRRADFALMGLVNCVVPFFLVAWGQTSLTSSVAAILNASAPLWTALLALAAGSSQRVGGLRLAGFVLGFAGVALVVAERGDARAELAGAVAVIGAAGLYAVGALFTGSRFRGIPPVVVALWTLVPAALFSLPLGLAQFQPRELGGDALAAALVLGFGPTGVAYLLYFGLIAGAGASRAILVTYLVPSLALVYGVTLLSERLTVTAVFGLVLVLAGVSLGTGALAGRRTRLA